jgi:phosphatidate cytidylyltransferase
MGVRFIIYLFLITIMTDMFAYFIGIKFGKRRLAPVISPKKSVEGAIAGSIAGTIFASLFALFYDIYPEALNPENLQTIFTGFSKLGELSRGLQALVIVPITFVATIVSQIGDLVASKFKRNYEIKDFGNIFPGHGGVVDRFDSSMLTSVFLVFLLTILIVVFPV